jgi:predicted GNAT family N-acyltransferase
MKTSLDGIQIVHADDMRRVHAACRLRYETFVIEGGDSRYADHLRKLHIDRYDLPGPHLWVAEQGADVVGTLRLVQRCAGPYLGDEYYGWATLAETLGGSVHSVQQSAVIISRGAIAKSHRRSGLFSVLCDVFEDRSRELGAKYILGVVAAGNDPSYRLLSERGYFVYHEDTFPSDWKGRCICKRLDIA